MTLPILHTPTFKLEIPSTKKDYKFRPFLVKEEKILIQAAESGNFSEMVNAACQIITNCSFGEIDGGELAMFDVQDLFIRIREKSIGETQEFSLTCGSCSETTSIDFDLSLLKVQGLDEIPNNKIDLGNEIGLILKYPASSVMAEGEEIDDDDIIIESIDYIYSGEETHYPEDVTEEELAEFIDSISIEKMGEIREFFYSMPKLEHIIDYKCPKCEEQQKISINGYEHFFV